jgi:antirestriction protein ArdC
MAYTKTSAEDKAMSRFTELLIDRIKEIQTDWSKPWIGPASHYPRNISGRPYNGSNSLMLMLHAEKEGYDIPVYATFERIMSLNLDKNKKPLDLPTVAVQRGEKSFPVFLTTFTVIDKETKEKIKFDDYKKLPDDEKEKYNVYPKQQVYNVFNLAAQTNLREARPEMYQQFADEFAPKLKVVNGEKFSFEPVDVAIEKGQWYCPVHLEYQDQAYYRKSDNSIHLPTREQFVDGESFVSTFFHEATHERQNALGLLKPSKFGDQSYSVSELEAEMSAALICQKYNITKTIKPESCAYLKSWLENINESPEYLKNMLANVKKESSQVMQRIDLIKSRIDQDKDLTVLEEAAEKVDFTEKAVTEHHPELVAEQSVGYHRHR